MNIKNQKIRMIILAIATACFVAGGILMWKNHQRNASAPAVASVSAPPKMQSLPGAGDPSNEYIKDQNLDNQKNALKARREGTSAVPTITRPNFVGNAAMFNDSASPRVCPANKTVVMYQPNPANCTLESLTLARSAGVTAEELRCQGCPCPALKAAGYTAGDLKNTGFTVKELKACGFDAKALAAAGFSDRELGLAKVRKPAATAEDDICSPENIRKARLAGVSAADLRAKGCDVAAMKAAGYTAAELKNAGYSAKDLKDAGFSAQDLKDAGFSAKDLKDAGFTAGQLKDAGFSAKDLKNAGFDAKQLRDAGFSAADLAKAGFSPKELAAAGYTKGDLLRAGFSPEQSGYPKTKKETASRDSASGSQFSDRRGSSPSSSGPSSVAADDDNVLGSSASIPSIDNVNRDDTIAKMEKALQNQMTAQQLADQTQQQAAAMMAQSQKLLQGWSQGSKQTMEAGVEPKESAVAKGAGGAGAGAGRDDDSNEDIVKAGSVMFATLDTSINTDETTPIMGTIVSGPYKGSKLVGEFKRVDKKVMLTFNVLNVPSLRKTVPINAVAIDPNTARTAVGGQVNSHYLLRYGSLFASAFAAGLSDALMTANTQEIQSPFMGTTVRLGQPLSAEQASLVAVGNVGRQYSNVMQQNFNRPPTVKIPAGVGLGLLFMQDTAIPKSDN